MTDDESGWLARMTPRERTRFLAATSQFLALQPKVRSAGEAAVMERSVVEAQDPVQARAYWRALSSHYDTLSGLHRELSELTAQMAAALDSQCEGE